MISIIIVSYNTCEITLQCLQSIEDVNLKFEYEVIVIDNNSHDNSVVEIKKRFPKVILVENNFNNFFAGANNQAVLLAKGNYLLLLNSDTVVLDGQLENLVLFLREADESIACVGPLVLNKDLSIQSQGYALPGIFERIAMVFKFGKIIKPASFALKVLPVGIPGLSNKNHQVGWVSGCCMLIKAEIYHSLKGLNVNLGFYGEEVEFCWKLQKNGFKTFLVTDSKLIHLGGQSSNVDFLKNLDGKLKRYAQLQRYTVGLKRAITMSQIVLFSAKLKLMFIKDPKVKNHFKDDIQYEKKVIHYLKSQLSIEKYTD